VWQRCGPAGVVGAGVVDVGAVGPVEVGAGVGGPVAGVVAVGGTTPVGADAAGFVACP